MLSDTSILFSTIPQNPEPQIQAPQTFFTKPQNPLKPKILNIYPHQLFWQKHRLKHPHLLEAVFLLGLFLWAVSKKHRLLEIASP